MKVNWTYFVLTIFVLTILASCATEKRCRSKFPPKTETVIEYRDSIREVVKWKDTTITVTLPPQIIVKEVIVPVPSDFKSDTVKAEGLYSTAKAWIERQRLQLELREGGELEVKLHKAIKESEFWKYKYQNESKIETITIKETPKFWLIMGIFGIASILFILYSIFKR